MRPSHLDRSKEQPASGTPVLNDPSTRQSAIRGVIDERNAAHSRIFELEQKLGAVEGQLSAATSRANDAMSQIDALQIEAKALREDAAGFNAYKADSEKRVAEQAEAIATLNKTLHDTKTLLSSSQYATSLAEDNLQRKTAALAEAESQIAELTKPKELHDAEPASDEEPSAQ